MKLVFIALTLSVSLFARDFSKLPSWAQPVCKTFNLQDIPKDAELYRLLDSTVITYRREDKWLVQRRIIQYVVTEKGSDQAALYMVSGDEDTTRVKKLRGWHLNSGDNLIKLDKDQVVTLGESSIRNISTSLSTYAQFEHIGKGSFVIFESKEIIDSFFSFGLRDSILEEFPIAIKSLSLRIDDRSKSGVTEKIIEKNMEGWGLTIDNRKHEIVFSNLPGYESEYLEPDSHDDYPVIFFGFIPNSDSMYGSWSAFGQWYYDAFMQACVPEKKPGKAGEIEILKAHHKFFKDKMSYRQKYLSTARGFIPEKGETAERQAYGDCKDLTSCLIYRASKDQVSGIPVLASIIDGGFPDESFPVSPVFNHVITAFPLDKSLDLPAEVEVAGKRYFIVDPTSNHTRFGYLPAGFKGRQVLLCTENGGVWATIPDSALENESLKIDVGGNLDADFTLAGKVQIKELGDAVFLRTLCENGNIQSIEEQIRVVLRIPGAVEIEELKYATSPDGVFQMDFNVEWPSFFQRDVHGFRLVPSVTGRKKYTLVVEGKMRQLPIGWDSSPNISWNIDLQSQISLFPGKDAKTGEFSFHKFSWKATGGKKIHIEYSTQKTRAFFSRENREEGVTYWQKYRSAFNHFYLNDTLFIPKS